MPSSLKWYDSNVKKVIRKEAQIGITRTAMLTRRQAAAQHHRQWPD